MDKAALFLLVVFTQVALAQDMSVKFNALTYEEGLSSHQNVHFVYHDTYGLVWVSAVGGVNCFSGSHNRIYVADPQDSTTLAYTISASSQFQEDESGDLWFPNAFALMQYDRSEDNFRRHNIEQPSGKAIRNEYYWSHLDTLTDLLYLCADRRVYVAHKDSIAKAQPLMDTNVSSESKMGTGENGELFLLENWSGSDYFIVDHLKGRTVLSSRKVKTPDGAFVNTTLFVSESLVYVGTETGVRTYNIAANKWGRFLSIPERVGGENDVRSLALLDEHQLLVATSERGIYIVDRPALEVVGKVRPHAASEDQIFEPNIYNIFIDEDHDLWVTTKSAGVLYGSLRKQKFATYLECPEGAEHILETQDGSIWINSLLGIYRVRERDTTFYRLPIDGEEVEQLTFLHQDDAKDIWAGSLEWMFKYSEREDSFLIVDPRPEFCADTLDNLPGYICAFSMPDGTTFFGTNDESILAVRPGTERGKWIHTGYNGIVSLYVRDKEVFAGTTDGTLHHGVLSGDRVIPQSPVSVGAIVTTMKPYGRDTLLLGSYGGLFLLHKSPGGDLVLERQGKVPEAGAQSVETGPDGKIWTAGPAGLYAFDLATEDLTTYHLSDGMQGENYLYDASLLRSDGSLLFGGAKGVNVFDPSGVTSAIAEPEPQVVGIVIRGSRDTFNRFSGGVKNPILVKKLRLPYQLNSLSLELSALEYSEPGECKFSYRIDGNGGLISTGKLLTLNQLGEGAYDLSLYATNADGVLSAQPRRLTIIILPPWYRTWWAYVLYGLAIAGLAFAFFWIRLQGIRKAEKEQLRAAKAEARAAETETSVLRLQMNPHFIFNSLNAVNAYILKGDKLRAHEYLVQFADLIRDPATLRGKRYLARHQRTAPRGKDHLTLSVR